MHQISNQPVTMHRDRQVLTTELFDQDLERGTFRNVAICLVNLVLGFNLARNFPNDLKCS